LNAYPTQKQSQSTVVLMGNGHLILKKIFFF
jgi:hypothetical protein